MPERIQLRRTKGWRLPAGAVVVARPSMWGNPFRVVRARSTRGGPWDMWAVVWIEQLGRFDSRRDAAADAVDRFRRAIIEQQTRRWRLAATLQEIRTDLAGKDLACWCPLDQPCHADVLLEIANSPAVTP